MFSEIRLDMLYKNVAKELPWMYVFLEKYMLDTKGKLALKYFGEGILLEKLTSMKWMFPT